MRVARAAGQWARIQRTKEARPYLVYELGPAEKHRPLHTRMPALYARTGHQGDAYLAVHGGRPTLVSSRDGLDTQVWPEWTEVIVTWSDGREDRAARLQPAHGRRTEVISQGVLEVRGRWTVVEWANTPATVGAMLVAAAPPG